MKTILLTTTAAVLWGLASATAQTERPDRLPDQSARPTPNQPQSQGGTREGVERSGRDERRATPGAAESPRGEMTSQIQRERETATGQRGQESEQDRPLQQRDRGEEREQGRRAQEQREPGRRVQEQNQGGRERDQRQRADEREEGQRGQSGDQRERTQQEQTQDRERRAQEREQRDGQRTQQEQRAQDREQGRRTQQERAQDRSQERAQEERQRASEGQERRDVERRQRDRVGAQDQRDRRTEEADRRGRRDESIQIPQEQRTRIVERLSREEREVRTDMNIRVSVGVELPREVKVRELPPDIVEIVPQYRGYYYTIVRDEIVIVEPRTRRVVTVLHRSGTESTGSRTERSARGGSRATARLHLDPEERRIVREYALEHGPKVDRPIRLRVGQRVPGRVDTDEFPKEIVEEVPELREYEYFVVEDEVIIVDPWERRVVEVIT